MVKRKAECLDTRIVTLLDRVVLDTNELSDNNMNVEREKQSPTCGTINSSTSMLKTDDENDPKLIIEDKLVGAVTRSANENDSLFHEGDSPDIVFKKLHLCNKEGDSSDIVYKRMHLRNKEGDSHDIVYKKMHLRNKEGDSHDIVYKKLHLCDNEEKNSIQTNNNTNCSDEEVSAHDVSKFSCDKEVSSHDVSKFSCDEEVSSHNVSKFSCDEERYIVDNDYSDTSSVKNENEQLITKESPTCVKSLSLSNLKEAHSYVFINSEEIDGLIPVVNVNGGLNELSDTLSVNDGQLRDGIHGSSTSLQDEDNLPNETQRSRTPSLESNGDHCRVCHCHGDEVLIAPCLCNGSLKYVHESCLITWMKNPFKDSCEICKKKILIVKKRKPIYTWKWPLQRPTPLVWVIVFTTAICVNLMSVVKDATQKCVSTSCIIFYVIGSVGIILASMFLYFWVKRVKVFCESWKVQNEHWVVKIEEESGKIV